MSKRPLAQRLSKVQPSATAAVFERVVALRADGADLISLSVGEPDFETPGHVRRAAKDAIDGGAIRYTAVAGLSRLREAIVMDSARRRRTPLKPSQVVVSAGAKHALFNLAQVLYEPGDRVLIPTPAWGTYAEQVRLCGAEPVAITTHAADGYLLQARALEEALQGGARALLLCSPSNPTGAAYASDQLRELAAVLAKHDTYVIVDEIYSRLVYDGFVCTSLMDVAPELADRTIVVDGVSKTFAMTGWRVGWCLAPTNIARACAMVQSQATTSISAVSQYAAIAALEGDQGCVEEMRRTFQARRDRLVAGLGQLDGVSCTRPVGAFYVFVDARKAIAAMGERGVTDDVSLATHLLEQVGLAVVPGSDFAAPGHLRLSYAASEAELDGALERLRRGLSSA